MKNEFNNNNQYYSDGGSGYEKKKADNFSKLIYGKLKHFTRTIQKWSASRWVYANPSCLQRINSGWFDNPITMMSIATHPCTLIDATFVIIFCFVFFFGFDWNMRNSFYQPNKIKATEFVVYTVQSGAWIWLKWNAIINGCVHWKILETIIPINISFTEAFCDGKPTFSGST